MKKILGSLFRVIVLLGIVAVIFAFFAFVVSPSRNQWEQSRILSAALTNARSVTVVEFTPHYFEPESGTSIHDEIVFQRIIATEDQIKQLRSSTGGFITFNIIGISAGCFTPHHRVEIVKRDGSILRFYVCFECRKFRFDKGYEQSLPSPWLPRLRQFFTSLGMPPRTDEEYEKLAEAKAKT
jgi:hypothetical protein